jgi:hypothetical protein
VIDAKVPVGPIVLVTGGGKGTGAGLKFGP